MAVFVALTVAIKFIPAPPQTHGVFHLLAFPIILAGILLGWQAGFWVGAISDIICFMLFPSGPFFPGFTLTKAMTGAIPALVIGKREKNIINLSWSIFCGQLITNILLVPAFQYILFKPTDNFVNGWLLFALPALWVQLIHVPIYVWLIRSVLKYIDTKKGTVLR